MVKAPWNRNRSRPSAVNIPSEVEEYYQSTHKERRGVAWLLSLATLALTLIIAGALFFGVKWAYRKFFANNNSGSTIINQPEELTPPSNSDTKSSDDKTGNNASSPDANSQDINLPSSDSNNNPPSSQNNYGPQPSSGSSETPKTGPEIPEIPHTGPTGND